jgi:Flp pilus assembly protein protease CpaA
MDDAPDPVGLPPSLKFLKWLVIVLMITMIVGVITIVGLLVTRMPDGGAPALPENVTLPDGAQPQAVTIGRDFILIVTEDNRVLVFGRDGIFRQEMLLSD